MAQPPDLLDESRIRGLLPADCAGRIQTLKVLDAVDSTNTWLMQAHLRFPALCLAEQQTAGRGRRGRAWVSPYGANLYLSLGWQFEALPPGFTALAMVAAIAVVQALQQLGVDGAAIKWPNDLYAGGKKLGGILVDSQGESAARIRAVIGIGINVHMPHAATEKIDQPWTDLAALAAGRVLQRNLLAAGIIMALLPTLDLFAARGFGAFAAAWRALDLVAGRSVELHQDAGVVSGTALGVDGDGALLLRTGNGTRRYVSGDLSLRLVT